MSSLGRVDPYESCLHCFDVKAEKSTWTATEARDLGWLPIKINLRLVSDGTVTINLIRIFSVANLYSRQLSPSSVLKRIWSVGSSSLAMTRTDPESPNSQRCASLWTSCHENPASRLRNVSLSVYGASDSPTFPTAMMRPTMDGLL